MFYFFPLSFLLFFPSSSSFHALLSCCPLFRHECWLWPFLAVGRRAKDPTSPCLHCLGPNGNPGTRWADCLEWSLSLGECRLGSRGIDRPSPRSPDQAVHEASVPSSQFPQPKPRLWVCGLRTGDVSSLFAWTKWEGFREAWPIPLSPVRVPPPSLFPGKKS